MEFDARILAHPPGVAGEAIRVPRDGDRPGAGSPLLKSVEMLGEELGLEGHSVSMRAPGQTDLGGSDSAVSGVAGGRFLRRDIVTAVATNPTRITVPTTNARIPVGVPNHPAHVALVGCGVGPPELVGAIGRSFCVFWPAT